MIATDYAKALYAVRTSDVQLLARLRAALKRRGHEQLLPQIYAEYQKLELHDTRLALHRRVTPQSERTRVLLELYRRLVRS